MKTIHQPPVNLTGHSNVAYYDTLGFLMHRFPHTDVGAELRAMCERGEIADQPKPIPVKIRRQVHGRLTTSTLPQWKILIQQPNQIAVERLDALARQYHWHMNQVHVTLEIPARTRSAAKEIQRWIDARLYKPWHRGPIGGFKGTSYSTPKRWLAKCFTVYSDRDGKMHPGPSCRIELRINGLMLVRQSGFVYPNDLLAISLREFWAENLSLADFDMVEIGVAVRRAGQRGRRPADRVWLHDRERERAERLLRDLASAICVHLSPERELPVVQLLRKACGRRKTLHGSLPTSCRRVVSKLNPAVLLHPLDPASLLPGNDYLSQIPYLSSSPLTKPSSPSE